jgi:atypical dual specificity phosphatase
LDLRQLRARTLLYPTLAWNYFLGRTLKLRNWYDEVAPGVYLGARPFSRDVAPLRKLGVTGVVNTCEEYAGPIIEYEKHGIDQLRVPTIDFTEMKLNDIEKGVEFVQRHLDEGGHVYIHCKAGRARSATIAVCWLVAALDITPEEAQAKVLFARPHANAKIYQRKNVQEFYRLRKEVAAAQKAAEKDAAAANEGAEKEPA